MLKTVKGKNRAGRNIKLVVTDDISHTGLVEEEYQILERHVEEQVRDIALDNLELLWKRTLDYNGK
ncbi:hypothetical protein [Peribacillus sp. SCS-155]|uniref:hypothetical protein n=1 Tax=Peribacillus sedimenti TaxID=3115297 RepID=UPI0039058B59